MDHQKEIANQRIINLHSGISKTEQFINKAQEMLNHENVDITQVQKELEEIQDFLEWLAIQ